MRIGALNFPYPMFLAPMAGVTDMAYRLLVKDMGCPLSFGEMVSVQGIRYRNEHTLKMLTTSPKERPIALQLFGRDPEMIAEGAKYVASLDVTDIIDFNMGCPVPKIVNNGEGSALMKEPKLAYCILQQLVKAVQLPVTVKIRLGWDREHLNAVEIAKLAEEAGVAAIAVHGRTRSEFYAGTADWEAIAAVKKAVKIPVIANGDVRDTKSLREIRRVTDCDGVMIGRAAQGNPWIFRDLIHFLKTGETLPPPTPEERAAALLRHLDLLSELKGEHTALREMRKHAAWYTKGIPGSAKLRVLFNQAESRDEFVRIISGALPFDSGRDLRPCTP